MATCNVIALVEKKSDVVPFFKASYVLNTRDNKIEVFEETNDENLNVLMPISLGT